MVIIECISRKRKNSTAEEANMSRWSSERDTETLRELLPCEKEAIDMNSGKKEKILLILNGLHGSSYEMKRLIELGN